MSIFKEYNIGIGRKALRELLRVKRDISGVFDKARFRLIQNRYDKQWPAQIALSAGTPIKGNKFAIFVLFQPHGVRASTFETCAHLTRSGFNVLVVSNCPLSQSDRSKLARHTYQICERPNYGYDAGAYRDGVKLLQSSKLSPSHVVLLNDSIWFPLSATNDTLSRLEDADSRFGGLVRKTKQKEDKKAGHETPGFIEAYFYHATLTTNEARQHYYRAWETLPLTVDRTGLREGRISQAHTKSKIDMTALASRTAFMDGVSAMSDEDLRTVLKYGAYPVPELHHAGEALLAAPPSGQWRQQALQHIEKTVSRYPFYGAFIYASETLFQLGFVKRTRTDLFDETRRAYLRAVQAGDLPSPSATVLTEIEALVASQ